MNQDSRGPADPSEPGGDPPPTVRGAVTRFALAGVAAVLLLGAVAYIQIGDVGEDQAIKGAQHVAGLIGHGVVEPELPPNPEANPERTRARLDEPVSGVLRDPLVRIKLWDEDGKIVYSDEPRLIGSTYGLGEDELAALRTGGVKAELTDLTKSENRFERDQGELLEVYFPITAPDGNRLLFEAYTRYDSVVSSGRDIRIAIIPALLGALALLAIVQIPLAARMARRIRDDYSRREALLRRAVDASDLERRRIAADLHDGVVQRMAGTTYTLDALAAARDPDPGEAKQALRDAAATTRASIRELRTTLIEIYPQGLERAGGLERAVLDLLSRFEPGGVKTGCRFESDAADLPLEQQQLLYRVAREALRNAEKHAEASTVEVRLEQSGERGERTRMTVTDDGRGFDPATTGAGEEGGHLGLPLLAELVADAGGELRIESSPGAGTTVTAELPR